MDLVSSGVDIDWNFVPYLGGREFTAIRKVRLGDANTSGRLRLDALTRYSQDVSNDDTTEAGLADSPTWVVRSTYVRTHQPAKLYEELQFRTFCGALSSTTAERRIVVTSDGGGHYDVSTLWVCISDDRRPRRLTEEFLGIYGSAANGRRAKTKSAIGVGVVATTTERLWQLRTADFDVFGHLNNAAYWETLEDCFNDTLLAGPNLAAIEYGSGVPKSDGVTLEVREGDSCGVVSWRSEGIRPTIGAAIEMGERI